MRFTSGAKRSIFVALCVWLLAFLFVVDGFDDLGDYGLQFLEHFIRAVLAEEPGRGY